MDGNKEQLASQLQAERTQTAELTLVLNEREEGIAVLEHERDEHRRVLATAENRSSQRETAALLEARKAAEAAHQEAEAARREGHRREAAAAAKARSE